MIPRTLHRVWLGGRAVPEEFEGYWARWGEMHPDWVLKTWGDDDLDWLVNRSTFDGAHNLSEASDVARFEILARYGGFYVDVDVEPLRCIEPLLRRHAVAGWEFSHRLGSAVLGSETGHPAFAALVERLPSYVEAHDDETSEKRTGPVFLTETWWRRRDVTRLARVAFYPVGWWPSERYKLDGPYPAESYTNHRWAGSWVKSDA
jgi:mannosyltransferase OCH1-like enzyme